MQISAQQVEKENGLAFGLKWSVVGMVLAICFLAGCSNIFGKELPRYNTVMGERRVPKLNPQMAAPAPQVELAAQPQPDLMPAPLPSQSAPALPPLAAIDESAVVVQPMPPKETLPKLGSLEPQDNPGDALKDEFPELMATPADKPDAPIKNNDDAKSAMLEAEIKSMEQELGVASKKRMDLEEALAAEEQAETSAPAKPVEQTTVKAMQPSPAQPPVDMMPGLLPVPDAATVPSPTPVPQELTAQPNAPAGIVAPVIDDAALPPSEQAALQPMDMPSLKAPEALMVEDAPVVAAAPTLRPLTSPTQSPATLMPLAKTRSYLPPSRYEGRYR